MEDKIMIKLRDILPIFKKHEVILKEKSKEVGDVYTFVFETKEGVIWKAGQHGVFTVKHKKIKKPTRAFSVASIPSEGHIRISMKISSTPSEFKKTLLDLEPGMSLSMRGPIGSLYQKEPKPRLLVAGGIGITPYRAMIKELAPNTGKHSDETQLIYMDSKEEFIYRKELDEANAHPSITITYVSTRDHLQKEMENFASNHKNTAEYYIVGSKPMIQSVETFLKTNGIEKNNIKKDVFVGY